MTKYDIPTTLLKVSMIVILLRLDRAYRQKLQPFCAGETSRALEMRQQNLGT
jgi:hypothetical protein